MMSAFLGQTLGYWTYGFPASPSGYACAFPWMGAYFFSFPMEHSLVILLMLQVLL
jgi:hypothetical protein